MRNLLNKMKEQVELFVLMQKLFYIKVSLCFWTAVEKWSKKQLEAEWYKEFIDNKLYHILR